MDRSQALITWRAPLPVVGAAPIAGWVTKPDSTWAWCLAPLDGGRTRLVSRVHAVYDWGHSLSAVLRVFLMEFGDFAMMRRMLLGIKGRTESVNRGPAS